GESARAVEPLMFHALIGRGPTIADDDRFERKLYVIRKRFETKIERSGLDDRKFFYFSSLSCRTVVYKGMLTPGQLPAYFADDLLVQSGCSITDAMMRLIPEAWENPETMSQAKKDSSAYHSCLMEPWDGPASTGFTDGKNIGAVLDRNGLRPSRYVVTRDGRV